MILFGKLKDENIELIKNIFFCFHAPPLVPTGGS
jgi:hypothetical protein